MKNEGESISRELQPQYETNIKKQKKTKFQKIKSALALTQENATPVNWKVIALSVFALYASCYSITYIFPFVPNMVVHFGFEEVEKGYYSGLIASAMFAGRIFGSYLWGWTSDKYGRKPVLIISLTLTCLTNLLFGFSVNLTMAIVVRFCNGLVNGIVGCCKAILYEISDSTNQGVGMSSISLAWGGGIIMGPLLSGHLSEPCKLYPSIFPEDGIFGKFPFLLPSIVATLMCALPIPFILWLLPETRRNKLEMSLEVKADNCDQDIQPDSTEMEVISKSKPSGLSALPLHLQAKPFGASLYSLKHADSEDLTGIDDDTSPVYGYGCVVATSHGDLLLPDIYSQPTHASTPRNKEFPGSTGNLFTPLRPVRQRSTQSLNRQPNQCSGNLPIETEEPLMVKYNEESGQSLPKKKSTLESFKDTRIWEVLSNRNARMSIAIYFTVSFGVIGYDEVFTVFASTDPSLGGLGLSPSAIGNALGLSAVPLIVLAVFLFPMLERRYGAKTVFNVFDLYLIFMAPVLPSLRVLQNESFGLFWGMLLTAMGLRGIAVTTCFSANGLHMNNSVTPALAGSVNGIAITIVAVGRMLAPTLGGSIFAWSITSGVKIGFPFDINLVFIVFGACYLTGNIICAMLPDSLDKQSKKDTD